MSDHVFSFTGKWETTLYLPEFEFFNNPELEGKQTRKTGYRNLRLGNEYTKDPDPTPAQFATISWLQQPKNQERLIEVLFNFCKSTVYPEYQAYLSLEEYPEAYPSLNKRKGLKKLLGQPAIEVMTMALEGLTYFLIYFRGCTRK